MKGEIIVKKLDFTDIKDEQIVDIRTQYDFQAGHIENSLNLNPSNFKKYATDHLLTNEPILFIVSSQEQSELEETFENAKKLGFSQIKGYVSIDDIPTEKLQQIKTISPEEFLNKKDNYILLDVRHPDEITRPAPEKNLINIPFEDLNNNCQSLDSSKEIYTLCGSGNRSTAAASSLKRKGYKPVVIEGGMKSIQNITQK